MYRLLMLVCFAQLVAAQTATQTCPDGRVLPLTPFNRNPCATAPPATPADNGPSSTSPAGAPDTESQPKTLICEDGRVVHRTPFNPHPCQVAAPAGPAEVPDEFLYLFGETPAALGVEIEDRMAERVYRSRFERFVAAAPEPELFDSVADLYARAGFGAPGFYRDRDGLRVRWPDAPFYVADAPLADAIAKPEAVLAAWQAQVVLRGGVTAAPTAALPATLQALNQERLEGNHGAEATTPTLLTWGASDQALAAHEDGVELVGPLGAAAGALTRPARRGDFVRLLLTGLGDAPALSVSIGGVTPEAEDFAFSRVADNRGGVHCLVVRVPRNTPIGDAPVTVTAAGVSSHAGPYLTVAR